VGRIGNPANTNSHGAILTCGVDVAREIWGVSQFLWQTSRNRVILQKMFPLVSRSKRPIMKSPFPGTQRRFANGWGELDYICKKIRFWLYERKQKAKAVRFLDRLARILRELPENNIAIIREEGLALLHQLKGEVDDAIAHREREIRLTERLHKEAQSHDDTTRAYMLRDRETIDLQERRAILEALKKDEAQRHKPKQPKKNRGIEAPWSPSAT
jgi:hypothetical protein